MPRAFLLPIAVVTALLMGALYLTGSFSSPQANAATLSPEAVQSMVSLKDREAKAYQQEQEAAALAAAQAAAEQAEADAQAAAEARARAEAEAAAAAAAKAEAEAAEESAVQAALAAQAAADAVEAADDDNDDALGDVIVGDLIDCPSGKDTHFKFAQNEHRFKVIGTLVSLDGSAVVVTGPEGDVTATVDADTKIKGSPQPGDPVRVKGKVLEDGTLHARWIKPACHIVEHVVGDVIDCPSGKDPHFRWWRFDNWFAVVGTLVSLDGSTVVVTGPNGDVTAAVDADTKIKGDTQPGDPVRVKGKVLEDGTFRAKWVKPACHDKGGQSHSSGEEPRGFHRGKHKGDNETAGFWSGHRKDRDGETDWSFRTRGRGGDGDGRGDGRISFRHR